MNRTGSVQSYHFDPVINGWVGILGIRYEVGNRTDSPKSVSSFDVVNEAIQTQLVTHGGA